VLSTIKPFFLVGNVVFELFSKIEYGWASIFELVLLNRIAGALDLNTTF
jgi:hypothetical protein